MSRGESIKQISLYVLLLLSLACFDPALADPPPLVVGIVTDDPRFSLHIRWFKAGMAELGYIEGENIKYISYHFIKNSPQPIHPESKKVLADDPDLLLAMGNYSMLWAGSFSQKTGIPSLFSNINNDPVREGIVESLSLPVGSTTGIRVPNILPKALEWLTASVPGIKKVFLPYDPTDEISMLAIEEVEKDLSQLKVELIFQEFSSVEEAVTTIEALPEDIGAIFAIPAVSTTRDNEILSLAATRRGLPVGSAHKFSKNDMVNLSSDPEMDGKQAAQMARRILTGSDPADLPVETLAVKLTINLKVAKTLGIHVPDSVLVNADTIIR